MDVAQNPHIEGKYEVMKQRMLTQFSQSKNQCVSRLLNMPDLRDDRPSVLINNMLSLLGDYRPDFLFLQFFS